ARAGRGGARRRERLAPAALPSAPRAVHRPPRLARSGGGVLEGAARRVQGPRRAHARQAPEDARVKPYDAVTVTTVVEVDPRTAFDVFTKEVGTWWRRDPRYRFDPERNGIMRFEPGAGGRLVEVHDQKSGEGFEVGRVLVWEPGARLVFEFRARAFAPGERTEVDVRFEPAGSGRTRLTLEH